MKQVINIRNSSPAVAVIDIEGVIGVSEAAQFEASDAGKEGGVGVVSTYGRFREAVEQIRALECDVVRVNIRSTGGNLNDALLIYEALCEIPARVETHCYGYVASAATVIAQAASAGGRYLSSGSLYLIHNAQTTLEGDSSEALRTAELLSKTDGQIAQIYAERSGTPVEAIRALMEQQNGQGKWLTPDEALGYGLVDEIEKANPLRKLSRKIKNFLSTFSDTSKPEFYSSSTSELSNSETNTECNSAADVEFLENRYRTELIYEPHIVSIRQEVKPTQTLPKQDPPIYVENKIECQTGNQAAYSGDLANFCY